MLPRSRNCERIAVRVGLLLLAVVGGVHAQTCYTGLEIDAPVAQAVGAAAQQYFQLSAKGDVAGLRANAMPEIAASFSGIEQAVVANQPYLAERQPSDTRIFLLDASDAKVALKRADFYCGIYNSADRIVFSIPNLPPGHYAVTIAKIVGEHPITLTLIVQEGEKNSWKLAGFYARRNSIGAHDGQWLLSKAREYKGKGQRFNAWFYYLTAWDLIAPVDFMGTPQLDKLSDEIQAARPGDLPGATTPLQLSASGKAFKITDMAAIPVPGDLDVRLQYETPDAANPTLATQDNLGVSKALLTKYPELRDAFGAVIVRATDDLGHTYTTLTPMKDVK